MLAILWWERLYIYSGFNV